MSYELTREEILHQILEVLREHDNIIENLYEKVIGGTVYYIGNDKFVVDDDEEEALLEEESDNPDAYAWDRPVED